MSYGSGRGNGFNRESIFRKVNHPIREDHSMEQTENYARYKMLFSILALVVLLWGAMGALEISKITYIGYDTSPDNVVTLVRPGSPAEQAGLRVGDVLTKVDGILVYDVAGFYNRQRPTIGSN